MEPFFSVVLPVYKTDYESIKRAILSIESQQFSDWELIVVDDNPMNTQWKRIARDVCDEINDYRVRLEVHEDNKGANAARNTGIKSAAGIYCAFLDADDAWDSDYLISAKCAIDRTGCDIVSSAYRVVTLTKSFDVIRKGAEEGNVYMKMIYKDQVGPTSAVIVKTEALRKINGFDVELPARQDYDTWLRVSKNGGTVAYVRQPKLSIFRTGQESISSRGMNHINGTEMVLKKLLSDPELKEYYSGIKAAHYMESAHFAIRQKNYKIAREYLKKTAKIHPSFKVVVYYIATYFSGLIELFRAIYRKLR